MPVPDPDCGGAPSDRLYGSAQATPDPLRGVPEPLSQKADRHPHRPLPRPHHAASDARADPGGEIEGLDQDPEQSEDPSAEDFQHVPQAAPEQDKGLSQVIQPSDQDPADRAHGNADRMQHPAIDLPSDPAETIPDIATDGCETVADRGQHHVIEPCDRISDTASQGIDTQPERPERRGDAVADRGQHKVVESFGNTADADEHPPGAASDEPH